MLNSTMNSAQRQGNGFQFLADSNSMTGIDIPFGTAATYYFNFSLPLVSLIGINANQKLFPIGLLTNLQLVMQTNAFLPISTYCTAVSVQPAMTFQLD